MQLQNMRSTLFNLFPHVNPTKVCFPHILHHIETGWGRKSKVITKGTHTVQREVGTWWPTGTELNKNGT